MTYKKNDIAAVLDAPVIDFTEAKDAGCILVEFYRALGWDCEASLDPRKVRTTKAVYDGLLDAMFEKHPDRLSVSAVMMNKGPGVDEHIPPGKLYLLKGWTIPCEESRDEIAQEGCNKESTTA